MFHRHPFLTPLFILLMVGSDMWAPRPGSARVISRGAEMSIGRETASQIEAFYRVDADPVAVARVRQIGQRLVAGMETPEFPFEFHVIESGEVNAFALPGGFIYVFRGLLQLIPNDDALAFVLAHEIAHVTRRHAIRQFEKNLLLSTGITAILAGAGAGRGVWRAADVVQTLAGLAFTRSDERDADEYGLRLLLSSGYNPSGALEAMALLQRVGGGDKGPDFLRTHPAPENRLKQLSQEVEATLAARKQAAIDTTLPPTAPPITLRRRNLRLPPGKLQATEWFPLRAGAHWLYETRQGETTARTAIRVLEPLRDGEGAAFRLELELGRGVRSILWVATTAECYYSLPETEPDASWRLEAIFPDAPSPRVQDGLRITGLETVAAPAGTFECVRVERSGTNGGLESVSWYSRGVGLVKREHTATGVRLELLHYRLPDAPSVSSHSSTPGTPMKDPNKTHRATPAGISK